MKKHAFSFFIVVFLVAFSITFAAGECVGISVSDVEFDLSTPAGETSSHQLTVRSQEEAEVTVSVMDWLRSDEGKLDYFQKGSGNVARSCADWIEFEEKEFVVSAGGKETIEFYFTVPEGVEGSYWAGIRVAGDIGADFKTGAFVKIYETVPTSGSEPTVSNKVPFSAVKSNCYDQLDMTKAEFLPSQIGRECISEKWLEENEISPGKPETSEKLDKKVKLNKFEMVSPKPAKFLMELKNSGKTFTDLTGNLRVTEKNKGVVLDHSLKNLRVLPGHNRRVYVEGEVGEGFEEGDYTTILTLEYGKGRIIESSFSFTVEPLPFDSDELAPICPSCEVPTNLDGDRLYEDVDGDGKLTEDDALILSFHIDVQVVQENAGAFDFNEDQQLTQEDAEELMKIVKGN